MPVECEDERPLAACIKARPRRLLKQSDAVRSGERDDDYEMLRDPDVALNAIKVGAARGRCEKLHVHVEILTRITLVRLTSRHLS